MKLSTIKSIEIFSDGTFHFSYVSLKSMKQVVFYEKNIKNSLFFRNPTENQSTQNQSRTSYKSRYTI